MIVEATPPHSLRGISIPKLYQCLRIRRQQKREHNNILNKDKHNNILNKDRKCTRQGSGRGNIHPPFKSFTCLTNDTRESLAIPEKIEYDEVGYIHGMGRVKRPIAKMKIRRVQSKVGMGRMERQSQMVHYLAKHQSLSMEQAYDWMMQMSSSLKISKNAYFRSVLILYRACRLEPSMRGAKFRQYICAALSIGWKFEYSPLKALQQICKRNSGYCSKGQIIQAQGDLLNLLSWQVPVQLMLEEMLNRLLPLGIAALMPAHRLRDRSILARRGWEEEKMRSIEVCKKMEIEIVYLVDFLLLMRTQQWLNSFNFTEPILIALYIVLSISIGDLSLDQFILWPYFQSFVVAQTPEQDLLRLHSEITHCFSQYNISQVLARIPLCLDFQTLGRRKYQQLYIRQTDPF